MTNPPNARSPEALKQQVADLKLHGLLAHWHTLSDEALAWLPQWLQWEHEERRRRGLQRRLSAAHIGRFKPLADFDWDWPTQCDKSSVSALMSLDFITEAVNVILVGPNGVGKSMIAQNIAYQAVMQGHSALFINAAQMLGDLAAQAVKQAFKELEAFCLVFIDWITLRIGPESHDRTQVFKRQDVFAPFGIHGLQ